MKYAGRMPAFSHLQHHAPMSQDDVLDFYVTTENRNYVCGKLIKCLGMLNLRSMLTLLIIAIASNDKNLG